MGISGFNSKNTFFEIAAADQEQFSRLKASSSNTFLILDQWVSVFCKYADRIEIYSPVDEDKVILC